MAKRIGNGLWIYEEGEDFLAVTDYCPNEAYDKSVADKEIAELKAQKAQAEDDRAYWHMREVNAVNMMRENEEACILLVKSERHQKFKRCLAMAKWCKAELETLDYKEATAYTNKDVWRIATSYFTIWRKRWLKLAEHFKPEAPEAK